MINLSAPNVLITSSGHKAPLVRAMQNAAKKLGAQTRVVAGDVNPQALARFVSDDFWTMPRSETSQIDAILDGCRARGIGVILPTRGGELLFWARVRPLFADAGISVVVSDVEGVNRCLDKLEFANFCCSLDLPAIPTSDHPDALGPGPYVVKERFGAGSVNIGLNLGRAEALMQGALLECPIYQPFVEGSEVSIDAWMDSDGEPHGIVLRRRDFVLNGEAQVSTTFRNIELEHAAAAGFKKLRLRGPAVMQVLLGPGLGWRIIECNARFGGASTTAIGAGLDMLYWSLCEARDPSYKPSFERILGEVRQVRLASDLLIYDPVF